MRELDVDNHTRVCHKNRGLCFRRLYQLETVTLLRSVTSIAISAINGRSTLTSITVPGSVSTIADHTFSCYRALKLINISFGHLYWCQSIFRVYELGIALIPRSVVSVRCGAFDKCSGLKTTFVPEGLK